MVLGRPVADSFIVAKAVNLGANAVVVSRETPSPNAAKLPNICDAFGVRYIKDDEFQKLLFNGMDS